MFQQGECTETSASQDILTLMKEWRIEAADPGDSDSGVQSERDQPTSDSRRRVLSARDQPTIDGHRRTVSGPSWAVGNGACYIFQAC